MTIDFSAGFFSLDEISCADLMVDINVVESGLAACSNDLPIRQPLNCSGRVQRREKDSTISISPNDF